MTSDDSPKAGSQGHVIRFGVHGIDITSSDLDFQPLSSNFLDVLRAFLEDTFETCSYHRNRMRQAGVTPAEIGSFADLSRLPVMWPSDVARASPFAFLPDKVRAAMAADGLGRLDPSERVAKTFMTSSSTGNPKVSYYTVADWDANLAMMQRFNAHLPANWIARVFNCFHAGHWGGKNIEDGFNRAGSLVENRHFSHTTVEETLVQLTSHALDIGGFTCLAVPPWRPQGPSKGVSLDDLLNADADNFIGAHVRVLVMGGTPSRAPGLRLRERVLEANELAGRPPTIFSERYGGSEVGVVVAECERGEMHVHPGLVHAEVVNGETGAHVTNGERGYVVFTGLRRGSRFVRYAVGDEATYVTDPCSCGKKTPVLRDIKRVLEPERIRGGCAAGGY